MRSSISRSFVAILLAGAVLLASTAARAAGTDDAGVCVVPAIPAGAVDPAGAAFFVTNDKGNIEAIDLKTGKTLWESSEAYRPLVVAGTKLVTQAAVKDKPQAVRIVLLDLKAEGKLIKQSEPFDVESYSDNDAYSSRQGGAAPGQATDATFSITAILDKADVIVTCRSSLVESGRVNHTRRTWASWRFTTDTAEVKKLGSGSTESNAGRPLPGKDPPEEKKVGDPDPALPPVPPDGLMPSSNTPKLHAWNRPWSCGDKGCLLLITPGKEKPQTDNVVTLHRWDVASRKNAEAIVLYEGRLPDGVDTGIWRTADGATVILVTLNKESRHAELFSAATGKSIADFDLKGTGTVRLLADGKTALLAPPADKDVQNLTFIDATTGKSLGEVKTKVSNDLKVTTIAGIIGDRIYTVSQGSAPDQGPLSSRGTGTLTAFDATRGEMLWTKTFRLRSYVDNTGLLAP
jgi:hypothetical protein